VGYIEHLGQLGYTPSIPMASKIDEWFGWYAADNDFYHQTEVSADGRTTYKVERLSIKPARMVCQEWASLLLNERTQIACDDPASNAFLNGADGRGGYFDSSRLLTNGQRLMERTFAMGTGAWALRVEGLGIDAGGNMQQSPDARIVAQRFDARQIIPLSYDEDSCTECAFVSKVVIGGKTLDQLQMHLLWEGRYIIETCFFDEDGHQVVPEGFAGQLVTNSLTPLFSLVRPGLENLYWDYSPFGVSVFDDALGGVKLTDAAVDNTYRDIWLGQKMLFLDERLLEKDAHGNVVVPRAKDQQLFRKSEVDTGQSMIEDYNPDLRVTDNRMALTTALEVLGQRTGLGNGYFSIEGTSGVQTATEVVAEQSDLFRNVRKHENSIEPALRTLVLGILSLARTVKGVTLPEDPGEIRVNFDDSVIEDTDAQRKRDLADVAAGLMMPWEYRVKWYGEDEKTAQSMIDSGVPPVDDTVTV
jgi:A118 family predicted phage portal protein